MGVYCFHIDNGSGLVTDEEGIDLPDLVSALKHALQSAQEFFQDSSTSADMLFEISDDTGRTVLTLPITCSGEGEVTQVVGDHLDRVAACVIKLEAGAGTREELYQLSAHLLALLALLKREPAIEVVIDDLYEAARRLVRDKATGQHLPMQAQCLREAHLRLHDQVSQSQGRRAGEVRESILRQTPRPHLTVVR